MSETMSETMSEAMTKAMTEAMRETVTLDAPSPLTFSEEETAVEERRSERTARLLETGKYPDKKLHLTEADLDAIVARFEAGQQENGAGSEVPVKVEHLDSPLDPLGHVRRVWREGSALFGTLAFPEDLAGFLRRRGAAKLSVGLTREPLALVEVSLVLKPRVASAALMGENDPGTFGPEFGPNPATSRDPSLLGKGEEVGQRGEIGRLREELAAWEALGAAREVETRVAAFKAQGRIVPASEAAARALLASPGEATVTLAEGPEPVAVVFGRFLEAQPPVVAFGESVAADFGAELAGFTYYEHMFLSKRLGVDPAKVAALMQEEKTQAERRRKGERDAYSPGD